VSEHPDIQYIEGLKLKFGDGYVDMRAYEAPILNFNAETKTIMSIMSSYITPLCKNGNYNTTQFFNPNVPHHWKQADNRPT